MSQPAAKKQKLLDDLQRAAAAVKGEGLRVEILNNGNVVVLPDEIGSSEGGAAEADEGDEGGSKPAEHDVVLYLPRSRRSVHASSGEPRLSHLCIRDATLSSHSSARSPLVAILLQRC
jgi:hypothetical protein